MSIPATGATPQIRQIKKHVSFSPRTLRAIKAAMVVQGERSFSRAVCDIVNEAQQANNQYFKGGK